MCTVVLGVHYISRHEKGGHLQSVMYCGVDLTVKSYQDVLDVHYISRHEKGIIVVWQFI